MKCPHCEAEVENAVEKAFMAEEIKRRLGPKSTEIEALKEALQAAKATASEHATAAEELESLRAELTAARESAARETAYTEHGIAGDEKVRQGFEAMYRSATTGMEDAPSFTDWLASEDARSHPLLSSHYRAPAADPGKAAPGQEQRRPSGSASRVDAGAHPPGSTSKLTAQQYREAVRAIAAKGLPPDKAREAKAQLDAQAGLGGG